MLSKIRAAKKFMQAGISLHLADGREEGVLQKVERGEEVGTIFKATNRKI